jgi:hypothetical protein
VVQPARHACQPGRRAPDFRNRADVNVGLYTDWQGHCYHPGVVDGCNQERAPCKARSRSHRRDPIALLILLFSFSAVGACESAFSRGTLPAALNNTEFWNLSTGFSEPPGAFTHSDNLVSNETQFVHLVRQLRPSGGVYIGVGPEQNFSYIARLRPAMAFIIDIRRENRNLHLMYKALFELSVDRADFLSRLFSRARPPRLGPRTAVQDLVAAYESAAPLARLYEHNAQSIRERLLDVHRFPLAEDDLATIDRAFNAFYSDGPRIHYGRSRPGGPASPSYGALMVATDIWGEPRSYLATEAAFAYVKDLHARNMIVPVVGDFAGPSAIVRVGNYVRHHAAIVSAFYGSNVEVYLNRQQTTAFCGSLRALPYDSRTWFIGSKDMLPFPSKLETCPPARAN